jgi:hypothetical protein
LGHRDGKCTLEAILERYGLTDKGLQRLARIVHAADVEEELDTDPIGRGPEAIAVGCSLRFPDDRENLARQSERSSNGNGIRTTLILVMERFAVGKGVDVLF